MNIDSIVDKMVHCEIKPLELHNGAVQGYWDFVKKGNCLQIHMEKHVVLGTKSKDIMIEKFNTNEMNWLLGDDFDTDLNKAVESFGMAQDEQGNYEYDATDENDKLTEYEMDSNGKIDFGDESESFIEELQI